MKREQIKVSLIYKETMVTRRRVGETLKFGLKQVDKAGIAQW